MDVFVFAVILVGLTAFVAAPLYRTPSGLLEAAETEPKAALEARRDAVLLALRDLEIDRASGLLDEAGYNHERTAFEAEAARLLEALAPRTD